MSVCATCGGAMLTEMPHRHLFGGKTVYSTQPMTPTDPETPQTAAGRAMLAWTERSGLFTARADILAIEAEARAVRDAEVRALPISQYPMVKGGAVEALISRAAVLAILDSDTPETGS